MRHAVLRKGFQATDSDLLACPAIYYYSYDLHVLAPPLVSPACITGLYHRLPWEGGRARVAVEVYKPLKGTLMHGCLARQNTKPVYISEIGSRLRHHDTLKKALESLP